jgi:hypothetical protein
VDQVAVAAKNQANQKRDRSQKTIVVPALDHHPMVPVTNIDETKSPSDLRLGLFLFRK